MPKIHIGCCGWNYKSWRGRFYPEKLPVKSWFSHYSKFFDTVELNNTFYRLPHSRSVESWEAQAPHKFVFAVKASRYITHMLKLKNVYEALKKFLDIVATPLQDHLGPILFQLPPSFHFQRERLESFLNLLPPDALYAFEFRHNSWFVDEVFQLLEAYGVSFCTHDMQGCEIPRLSFGPITYVRLHGGDVKYAGNYPDEALGDWWNWMQTQLTRGKDLYVYFNNDMNAHAVYNALRLKEFAGESISIPRVQEFLWHDHEWK
jgi:uncharacterized protein YecE (DUF72 family)